MAYHLKRSESVAEGIRRIAREEIESAAGQLSKGHRDRDEAIHEARKSIKKVRAVLRLVHPELGDTYYQETSYLRDVGRKLSLYRDAAAVIEILDSLEQKYRNRLKASTVESIRRGLLARKEQSEREADIQKALTEIAMSLRVAARRVKAWPLQTDGFPAIESGFEKMFRQGQKALIRAQKCPRPENYHEWRKRVKDHWYHARLLENLWNDIVQAYEKSLDDIQAWLGDDHNLVLLRAKIVAEADTYGNDQELSPLLKLVDKYQKDLRAASVSLGRRIYEAKSRHVVRRMRQLWDEWQVQPQSLEELRKGAAIPGKSR